MITTTNGPAGERDVEIIFGSLAEAGADYIHVTEFEAWKPAFAGGSPSSMNLAKRYAPGVAVSANGGLHNLPQAVAALGDGADILTIGRGALANPDLPQRLRNGEGLAEFNPAILGTCRHHQGFRVGDVVVDAGEAPGAVWPLALVSGWDKEDRRSRPVASFCGLSRFADTEQQGFSGEKITRGEAFSERVYNRAKAKAGVGGENARQAHGRAQGPCPQTQLLRQVQGLPQILFGGVRRGAILVQQDLRAHPQQLRDGPEFAGPAGAGQGRLDGGARLGMVACASEAFRQGELEFWVPAAHAPQARDSLGQEVEPCRKIPFFDRQGAAQASRPGLVEGKAVLVRNARAQVQGVPGSVQVGGPAGQGGRRPSPGRSIGDRRWPSVAASESLALAMAAAWSA